MTGHAVWEIQFWSDAGIRASIGRNFKHMGRILSNCIENLGTKGWRPFDVSINRR